MLIVITQFWDIDSWYIISRIDEEDDEFEEERMDTSKQEDTAAEERCKYGCVIELAK